MAGNVPLDIDFDLHPGTVNYTFYVFDERALASGVYITHRDRNEFLVLDSYGDYHERLDPEQNTHRLQLSVPHGEIWKLLHNIEIIDLPNVACTLKWPY